MKTENTFSAARLHQRARALFQQSQAQLCDLRAGLVEVGGATILDCGVHEIGSLQSGVLLARLCLGDHADVSITAAEPEMVSDMAITVCTDRPIAACLGGQYAGWPVAVGKFFAMASGPMRMFRGREEMLQHLDMITPADSESYAVGVLESDRLPDMETVAEIASACGVPAERLCLGIAPVTSIAGCVQVVARSVETALHKLHALDFDVTRITSATGIAPLPPCAKPGDTVHGIGRTNDAMLYGSKVSLWVDAPDAAIEAVAAKVPSHSSSDYGKPFAKIFKQYDYDFYKVDPMLFSPAVVTIHSLASGRTWRSGRLAPHLLRTSFGMDS